MVFARCHIPRSQLPLDRTSSPLEGACAMRAHDEGEGQRERAQRVRLAIRS